MKSKLKIRNDIILVCVILIFAVCGFLIIKFGLKNGESVLVSVDGRAVFTANLNDTYTEKIITENGYNLIEIRDSSVRVKSADCRDNICVNHRPISNTGETVVCLPHKLVVEIKGEN